MRVKRNDELADDILSTISPGNTRLENCNELKDGAVINPQVEGSSTTTARQTLEKAIEHLSPTQRLQLARQLGYSSFANLLAASRAVTLSDGSAWWLTADRNGAWMAWNFCALGFPVDCQQPM